MTETRRYLIKIIIIPSLLILTSLITENIAAVESVDSEDKNVDMDEWTDHEELGEELNLIEEKSEGKVAIEVQGHSQEGREIYSARVGSGDKVILINSEMDGKQKNGTETILSLLETLGTSDSEEVQAVRDEITVVAVPKLNPDGSELVKKENDISWEEVIKNFPQLEDSEIANYYEEELNGIEINRDFNADLDYEPQLEDFPGSASQFGFFLSNEARILGDLYQDLAEEFEEVTAYVDLRQTGGNYDAEDLQVEGSDEEVTMALNYPMLGPDNNPRYIEEWPEWDQDESRRYALAAANGVNENAEGNEEVGLTRFLNPETYDLPGVAMNAFALNGTAGVMFEMPGQQPEYGWNQEQIDLMEDGLWGILGHMADGTIEDLDGDDYYELPKYWPSEPRVSEPAQYTTNFTNNEEGEMPEDWSPIWQGEEGHFSVLGEPDRLQFSAESGTQGITFDEVGEVYGSTEIFGLIRGNDIQEETLFEINLSMSGASNSENSIYMDAQISDEENGESVVRLMQRKGGSTDILGSEKLSYILEEGKWYRVLLQREATDLRIKIWPDGEDEPEHWHVVEEEDSMYGGQVGISHSTANETIDYAFIGVGVGGERAPHAPEGLLNTGDSD